MSAPPRSIAWVLLLASAAAVLLTGLVATSLIVSGVGSNAIDFDAGFALRLLAACVLTAAGLGLRALRWVFLLRRSDVRIPIRDAYIAYLSGFSLLLAPFLLGEIVVRAYVHRARAGVAPAKIVFLNIWERLYDVIALSVIATFAWLAARDATGPAVAVAVAASLASGRLTSVRSSFATLTVSVAAWLLPGLGFWVLAAGTPQAMSLLDAQLAFARSSLAGGITLAPGGVLVTGSSLLSAVQAAGAGQADAVAIVIGIRLATVGVSTALGVVMLVLHFAAARPGGGGAHFDEIAGAYDVQIPEGRREALLATKTMLMRDALARSGAGARGLDVGCGHGWYVRRMRDLGFDVHGIDTSAGQLAMAARQVGADAVREGSILDIPAAGASYDFVYTINVLHHLPSTADQRAAFAELARVLKPRGLLFVHEINTTNPLFRFYMGYIFPSLNCIDEGVERWLLPERMADYTDLEVVTIRYFTFLPEFLPQPIVRALSPIERWLERSRFARYSAHYMAVLRTPA